MVEIFRNLFKVNQNLLFLIFGQMIPEEGFGGLLDNVIDNKRTLKSMKTQDLADYRREEKFSLDDSI